MSKRRKLTMLVCILALIGLGAGGMIAYFTNQANKNNNLTVGYNEIAVIEDFEAPDALAKGVNSYKKKVQIENTGTTDAFVRVYAAFSDSDIADMSFIAANAPDNVTVADDATIDLVTQAMETAGYKRSADFWTVNGPSNDWVYIPVTEDATLGGYFYYSKAIAPGEKTGDLINTAATWFETEGGVKSYEIIVYAESVQTANKEGVAFANADYQNAWMEYLTRK